jgi:hypothetical protein
MRTFLFKRKTLTVTLAITLLVLSLGSVALSQALAITTNDFVPFAQAVFVPCANGGAGETVLISGTLHVQNHITINDNRVSLKVHFQPQGGTGVGLTTGDSYQATGVTQEHDSLPLIDGAANFTFVNNFKIIGTGPNNNLLVHQTVHVTIDANGFVTTVVDNLTVECR